MNHELIDLISNFIFTWLIGLGLPAIVRYVVYRRQLLNAEALTWAVVLGFSELFLFSALGSQNKTHLVLILIGWVAYRMMIKESNSSKKNVLGERDVTTDAEKKEQSAANFPKKRAYVRAVAILLNIGLLIFIVIQLEMHGLPSGATESLLLVVLFLTPLVNLYVITLGSPENLIALYFVRKALEEQRKIEELSRGK